MGRTISSLNNKYNRNGEIDNFEVLDKTDRKILDKLFAISNLYNSASSYFA